MLESLLIDYSCSSSSSEEEEVIVRKRTRKLPARLKESYLEEALPVQYKDSEYTMPVQSCMYYLALAKTSTLWSYCVNREDCGGLQPEWQKIHYQN